VLCHAILATVFHYPAVDERVVLMMCCDRVMATVLCYAVVLQDHRREAVGMLHDIDPDATWLDGDEDMIASTSSSVDVFADPMETNGPVPMHDDALDGTWQAVGEDDEGPESPPPSPLPPGLRPTLAASSGQSPTADQIPPVPPPTCRCFDEQPNPRRPQHTTIFSPYCPLLPYPEYREEPCVCFATVPEPSSLTPHSDVTSPHCPFFSASGRSRIDRAARATSTSTSRSQAAGCTSCGELGHRNMRSALCQHRISGRVFQAFVEGSPGRKYHDEEAPTLSERCPHCKSYVSVVLETRII
jgi:hypothetical protein